MNHCEQTNVVGVLTFSMLTCVQQVMASSPAEASSSQSEGLLGMLESCGALGIAVWAGIFLCTVLVVPLGLLSVVRSIITVPRQWPVATKLLPCFAAWLFILGWGGLAQGAIGAFGQMANGPNAATATALANNISHAFWSIGWAVFFMQFYLFFFTVSIVILHFKTDRSEDETKREQ